MCAAGSFGDDCSQSAKGIAMFDWWHQRYARRDVRAVAQAAGKTPYVVVTGGSDGIGLEIARLFRRDGHSVLLIARTEARLQAAAVALHHGDGAKVAVLALDITSASAVDQIDQALDRLGGYVDVLVNCAGIGASGAFADQSPEEQSKLIDLNVRALATLSRHVLPGMRARGRGGLLNVASLGGFAPGPYQAAYYASKAFVISLTEALAFEHRGQGLAITVVAPGPVRTAFHGRMAAENGLYLRLLPVHSAEAVARSAYRGYLRGQWVVVPGLINNIMVIGMLITPHRLLLPIMEWLLDPRRSSPPRG